MHITYAFTSTKFGLNFYSKRNLVYKFAKLCVNSIIIEENNYYINYLFDSKTIRKYNCDINENIIYNDYSYPMVVDLSLSPKV
mgnify:CR=1 FL=1